MGTIDSNSFNQYRGECVLNPQIFWHTFRLIVIFVFPLHIFGCASLGPTKPNIPFAGSSYPTELNELAQKNPLLAYELGKLPELQDEISSSESFAIESFVQLYIQNPAAFDKAFKDMFQEGLPEVRKYCSPLQALFWIVQDGDNENELLHKYDLINLLNLAWYKKGFEYDGKGRWDDFKVVVDRLNSPDLVHYYMRRNFPQGLPEGRKGGDVPLPPKVMFNDKYGTCRDSSNFGKYCLKKAGYEAKIILLEKGKKGAGQSAAVEFKDMDGNDYIIDTFKMNAVIPKEAYLELFEFSGYLY